MKPNDSKKHGALPKIFLLRSVLVLCHAAVFYSVTYKKTFFFSLKNLLYNMPYIGIFQTSPSVSYKDEGDLIFESNLAHSPPTGTAFKPVLAII